MSSLKESIGGADTLSNDPFNLSEGESVEPNEEERDTIVENIDNEETEDSKKRKATSDVWNHFVKIQVKEQGKMVKKHQCTHCKKTYAHIQGGTSSTLRRHLISCPYMVMLRGNKKSYINFDKCDSDSASAFNSVGSYDQLKCREIIAKMIVAHELPFSFVEYHWFNELMKYNNPFYQKVSRSIIRKNCIKVVKVEREKLKKVLKNIDMISLASDCWTSKQTIGYMTLTAHFIDSNWKMQKCIIGFNELAPPHSGEVISEGILECLMKWGIQDKIGTITLDNASNNDRASTILRNNFQGKGKLHFEGLFFHVRCCAHILILVVQDGLGKIDSCLMKIREGVKYLRKSPGRLLKFGEIEITLGIHTHRSLCTGVKTRWNSTHRMLESAIHYKLAFQGYALRDSNFEWSPTDVEWDRAEKVCMVLEVFLDATNLFSGTSYPTSNLFLVEIFKVKKAITNAFLSDDEFLNNMSVPMYDKFEKYWGEIGLRMSIASILDPRFKLASVYWTFERLYSERELNGRVEEVTNNLKSLFEKYSNAFLAARAAKSSSTSSSLDAPDIRARREDDFYAFLKSRPVENTQKNELLVYLEEPNYEVMENTNFCVNVVEPK